MGWLAWATLHTSETQVLLLSLYPGPGYGLKSCNLQRHAVWSTPRVMTGLTFLTDLMTPPRGYSQKSFQTHFMTASFPLLSLQINVAHFNFYLKMWPFKYVDFNFIVINLDFTAATIFQYLIWNGTWSFYAIKCVCSKNWLIKHESK